MLEEGTYSIGWEDEDDEYSDQECCVVEERGVRSPDHGASAPAAPAPSAPVPIARAAAFAPKFVAELPYFPHADLESYFPVFFARSGLFAAERVERSPERPPPAPGAPVLGQDGMAGTLSGARLSMNDKLVFEAIVILAKRGRLRLHEPLRCSIRSIAQLMGWRKDGGGTHRYIRAALDRFTRTKLVFDLGDGVPRSGKLLASVKTLRDKSVEVLFDANFILPAFGVPKQYRINRGRREALSSPLAKWLHDFASTHSKPRAIDLKYLRERTGFGGPAKKFVQRLRRAVDEVAEKAPELLERYSFDDYARSSEKWTIALKRGAEKAGFVPR